MSATTQALKPVLVVGAGTMGNGIAQTFATGGHPVLLLEANEAALKRGLATIEKSLAKFVEKGKLDAAKRDETLARIATRESDFPMEACAIAVEAVPEKFDIKRAVFQSLDAKLPPDAILATNTSSLSITELAAMTKRPRRFVGMHFMNPVPLMPLVEVVRGLDTSDMDNLRDRG